MKRFSRSLLMTLAVVFLMVGLSMVANAGPTPAVTPDTACGARGIGRDANTFEVVEMASAGHRVDSTGTWVACDRPCTPERFATTWTVAGNTCTVPLPTEAVLHSRTSYRQQWQGPMRGQLVERCVDQAPVLLGATCAPATHCTTEYKFDRDGVRYVYDARPVGAAVPVGRTVDAIGPDKQRWPLSCVAGDWVFPLALPTAPTIRVAASAPALWCGAQTFNAGAPGRTVKWRYSGPRVQFGAEVAVRSAAGVPGVAVCGAEARLVLR